jgi:glycosyltransferase involved in cell wall biosynthesis
MNETSEKRILCIAHLFPPVAWTGAHRTRGVVRHLPAHGWTPVVVTARPHPVMRIDSSLLEGLPEGLMVYRTPAPALLPLLGGLWGRVRRLLSPGHGTSAGMANGHENGTAPAKARGLLDSLTWCLKVPDMAVGWIPWGLHTALRAAARHKCRAIYTTAPPWSTHVIGLLVKRRTGLPWIADFRDPWRGNPFHHIPYPRLDRYDAWLERCVVSQADGVICNSEAVRRDFMSRFPDHADHFVTIPNGFDPEDFAGIEPRRLVGPDRLVLTHAGCFYGRRRPDSLFQAIRLLLDRGTLGERLCLQLVGETMYEGKPLADLGAEYGVAGQVLLPGEVAHRQVLELLRGSDIQVLVGIGGAGGELQVPAKLYEYMGIGRPVLSLASRESAIAEVMTSLGPLGELCDPEDPEQIAATIERMAARRYSPDGAAREGVRLFHRKEQVARMAELLVADEKKGAHAVAGGPTTQAGVGRSESGPGKAGMLCSARVV